MWSSWNGNLLLRLRINRLSWKGERRCSLKLADWLLDTNVGFLPCSYYTVAGVSVWRFLLKNEKNWLPNSNNGDVIDLKLRGHFVSISETNWDSCENKENAGCSFSIYFILHFSPQLKLSSRTSKFFFTMGTFAIELLCKCAWCNKQKLESWTWISARKPCRSSPCRD